MFTQLKKTLRSIRPELVILTFALHGTCSAADQVSAMPANEKAIRATADDFAKAFNAGDAKQVAAQWAADGTLVDEAGQFFKGQLAIEKEYATLFKQHPGAKIDIAIQSIQFPTPGIAIEDGLASVVEKNGGPPSQGRYAAVHVLQDKKWVMTTVRESHVDSAASSGRLQQLDWLVGRWQTKKDNATVEADFRWIANKSFIERQYTERQNGTVASSGIQIIGWDPVSQRVRSWSFDSSGGYGIGRWSQTADGWRIDSSGVLADGTPTSSREALIRVAGENDVVGWQSTRRMAGNMALSDTAEVVLDRVNTKP